MLLITTWIDNYFLKLNYCHALGENQRRINKADSSCKQASGIDPYYKKDLFHLPIHLRMQPVALLTCTPPVFPDISRNLL